MFPIYFNEVLQISMVGGMGQVLQLPSEFHPTLDTVNGAVDHLRAKFPELLQGLKLVNLASNKTVFPGVFYIEGNKRVPLIADWQLVNSNNEMSGVANLVRTYWRSGEQYGDLFAQYELNRLASQ